MQLKKTRSSSNEMQGSTNYVMLENKKSGVKKVIRYDEEFY